MAQKPSTQMRLSIYQQRASPGNSWPDFKDTPEDLPDNIWTHVKLPNNYSKNQNFLTGHVVSVKNSKVNVSSIYDCLFYSRCI